MSNGKAGHWLSLVKSFDTQFYRSIVNQSFSRSFVYVMLLSFAVSLTLSARYVFTLNSLMPRVRHFVLTQIPDNWPKELTEIRIEKGQVYSAVAQPFTHKWGEFMFILDTTGKVNSLEEYNQGILIKKDKVVFKTKESKYETKINEYDLSKVDSFIIRQGNPARSIVAEIITKGKSFNITDETLKFLSKVFCLIAFFAMFFGFFFYYLTAKIIQAVTFSLFGVLANKITKANLGYDALLNISIYALTPATLVSVIVMLTGIRIPAFWLLYCLFFIVYLVLGIKDAKESLDMQRQPCA